MGVFVGLSLGGVWNGASDLQAGVEIYYWEHPQNFGSFRAAKMTPFWDPKFTPPVWSIGGPISLCPQGAGLKSRLYTQI